MPPSSSHAPPEPSRQLDPAAGSLAAAAAGIGLWMWDPTTDVVTWEDTMCALYGRAPGDVPRTRDAYLALIHPEDRERSRQRIARGQGDGHWEHEYRIVRPDGRVRWLASRSRVVHTDRGDLVLGAVFDVTERREMEERQLATQRLEVVGQLTAGIAHNFNNLLMGLVPTLEIASRSAPPDLVPLLRMAEESAQRAARVVRQLMTYAAPKARSRRPEAVAPLVERMVGFSRSTLDQRIALEMQCEDVGTADVDANQIEQAILNLLINARDALEDSSIESPTIRVVVEPVPAGSPELEGRAGEWAAVRVIDNGVGMDAETLERIYEPFFTTKPLGKGTGLGLATTHAILHDHQGFVACHSAPGLGAAVSLLLPLQSGAVAPPATRETSSKAAAPAVRKSVVLAVDDDEAVRRVLLRVLAGEEFAVETVACGAEALARIADAKAPPVEVVLLDVSMPGMSGPETRRHLAEVAPNVPVVFLTGYAYESSENDTVVQKPVTQAELVSRVREAIRRGPKTH
jgi:PAS domain S-box-containing protein